MLARFKRTGQPLLIIVLAHRDLAGLKRAVRVNEVTQLHANISPRNSRDWPRRGAFFCTDSNG